jgi:predicted transcriptional regulator
MSTDTAVRADGRSRRSLPAACIGAHANACDDATKPDAIRLNPEVDAFALLSAGTYFLSLEAVACTGITGNTRRMKTAISLPDDLSLAIDACARELKMTRSGLLAQAAREFVTRHRRGPDATEAWNKVVDAVGQPGDDPAARAFRRRTKAVVRASTQSRR